jgi:hypothetical protein
MKKITDNELLDIITKSTLEIHGPMWLENIQYNEKKYGFNDTLNGIKIKSSKTLVIAAGPTFKKVFGKNFQEIMKKRNEITIVACDGALSMLTEINCIPDYVVSVDGDPIIANFYKKSKKILRGVTVILATSINPNVVKECIDAGAKIKWVQPFFRNNSEEEFFRDGITSIKMGGNVGTASYILTAFALKGNPIGLMGIEFAWSDDTPYSDTQYYNQLMKSFDKNQEKVEEQFIHVNNPRNGNVYIADPVYYAYFLMLKEIWSELPSEIKDNTYNLTSEGILNIDDLKYIHIKKFLELEQK